MTREIWGVGGRLQPSQGVPNPSHPKIARWRTSVCPSAVLASPDWPGRVVGGDQRARLSVVGEKRPRHLGMVSAGGGRDQPRPTMGPVGTAAPRSGSKSWRSSISCSASTAWDRKLYSPNRGPLLALKCVCGTAGRHLCATATEPCKSQTADDS